MIGRKIKISVKKKVKLEVKGDRVENKVLVSDWRHLGAEEVSAPPFPLHWFSCSLPGSA